MYYPTAFLWGNCVFLLCPEPVNYCQGNSFGYWLGLYHGLVSRFAANNTKALIDLRDEDSRTGRCYVAMADMRHGLSPYNTHNIVVHGQKRKVLVLVFLVRTSGTLWDHLSRLDESFCFSTKPHRDQQLRQGTRLCMSSNWLCNKTVISCLFVEESNYNPSVSWTTWCTIARYLWPRTIVYQVVHGNSG